MASTRSRSSAESQAHVFSHGEGAGIPNSNVGTASNIGEQAPLAEDSIPQQAAEVEDTMPQQPDGNNLESSEPHGSIPDPAANPTSQPTVNSTASVNGVPPPVGMPSAVNNLGNYPQGIPNVGPYSFVGPFLPGNPAANPATVEMPGIPTVGVPNHGYYYPSAPNFAIPNQGSPQSSTPNFAFTGQGSPHPSIPNIGIPNQGSSNSSIPNPGTQPAGFAPGGMPFPFPNMGLPGMQFPGAYMNVLPQSYFVPQPVEATPDAIDYDGFHYRQTMATPSKQSVAHLCETALQILKQRLDGDNLKDSTMPSMISALTHRTTFENFDAMRIQQFSRLPLELKKTLLPEDIVGMLKSFFLLLESVGLKDLLAPDNVIMAFHNNSHPHVLTDTRLLMDTLNRSYKSKDGEKLTFDESFNIPLTSRLLMFFDKLFPVDDFIQLVEANYSKLLGNVDYLYAWGFLKSLKRVVFNLFTSDEHAVTNLNVSKFLEAITDKYVSSLPKTDITLLWGLLTNIPHVANLFKDGINTDAPDFAGLSLNRTSEFVLRNGDVFQNTIAIPIVGGAQHSSTQHRGPGFSKKKSNQKSFKPKSFHLPGKSYSSPYKPDEHKSDGKTQKFNKKGKKGNKRPPHSGKKSDKPPSFSTNTVFLDPDYNESESDKEEIEDLSKEVNALSIDKVSSNTNHFLIDTGAATSIAFSDTPGIYNVVEKSTTLIAGDREIPSSSVGVLDIQIGSQRLSIEVVISERWLGHSTGGILSVAQLLKHGVTLNVGDVPALTYKDNTVGLVTYKNGLIYLDIGKSSKKLEKEFLPPRSLKGGRPIKQGSKSNKCLR